MLFTELKNMSPSQSYRISISENTYNYITRTNFKANFPKMAKFEFQNLSPPTFFEINVYNLVDVTFRSILREFIT